MLLTGRTDVFSLSRPMHFPRVCARIEKCRVLSVSFHEKMDKPSSLKKAHSVVYGKFELRIFYGVVTTKFVPSYKHCSIFKPKKKLAVPFMFFRLETEKSLLMMVCVAVYHKNLWQE